jgi:hypothetical protein
VRENIAESRQVGTKPMQREKKLEGRDERIATCNTLRIMEAPENE